MSHQLFPNPASGGTSSLAADTDVNLTSPIDGDLLTYDVLSLRWVNRQPDIPIQSQIQVPVDSSAPAYPQVGDLVCWGVNYAADGVIAADNSSQIMGVMIADLGSNEITIQTEGLLFVNASTSVEIGELVMASPSVAGTAIFARPGFEADVKFIAGVCTNAFDSFGQCQILLDRYNIPGGTFDMTSGTFTIDDGSDGSAESFVVDDGTFV